MAPPCIGYLRPFRLFCLLVAVLASFTNAQPVTYHFNFTSFDPSNVNDFSLVNSDLHNGSIRLTQSTTGTRFGAVWYSANRVHLDAFNTTFTLLMQNQNVSGVRDGISFVIQNAAAGIDALVTSLGGLGYGSVTSNNGLTSSLAVEFDTFPDGDLGDPPTDHISIHSLGSQANSANESHALAPAQAGIRPLRGSPLTIKLIYVNKTLSVFIVPNGGASYTAAYDVVENLDLKGNGGDGRAWIGFTSSCGEGMCAAQELLSWEFNYLGVTTAADSFATGAGISAGVAGETGNFTIQAVDQFGWNVTHGGDTFVVNLEPAAVSVTVTDNKNGTYFVTYNATVSTAYQMNVTLNGAHIKGSPFTVGIVAGSIDAPNCVASGDGLSGPAVAGTERNITITAKDRFNNTITQSGEAADFMVSIVNASGAIVFDGTPKEVGGGLYDISYNLTDAGQHNISISLAGQGPILGSPFPPFAVVPADPSAPNCSAEGNGVLGGFVGEIQSFNITVRDRFGNLITNGIPNNFSFKVVLGNAENTVNGAVVQNTGPNGSIVFTGTYNATVSGQYQMNVTLNNAPIQGSPFNLVVLPDNSAWGPRCIAYGNGTSLGTAGVTELFTIQSRDQFGNNMTANNDSFTVTFTRSDGKPANVQTTVTKSPLGGGKFDVSYSTIEAFPTYRINVTLLGLQIANGTLNCNVIPSAVYPPLCTAFGPGTTRASQGRAETFNITTRDQFNNLLITGGLNVSVVLTDGSNGRTVRAAIKDWNNGTYTVTYKLDSTGHYMMKVLINGDNIADSPFFIEIPEEGFDTNIFIWIGLGAGGGLVLVILIAAFFLWRRYKKRTGYQAFGL